MTDVLSTLDYWKRLSRKRKIWEVDTVNKLFKIYKRHAGRNSFGQTHPPPGVIPARNAPPPFPQYISTPPPPPFVAPRNWALIDENPAKKTYTYIITPREGSKPLFPPDFPWEQGVIHSPLKKRKADQFKYFYQNVLTEQRVYDIKEVFRQQAGKRGDTVLRIQQGRTPANKRPAAPPGPDGYKEKMVKANRELQEVKRIKREEEERDEALGHVALDTDFIDELPFF